MSSSTPSKTLQSLVYRTTGDENPQTLQVLDQLRLPHESVYIDITNVQNAFDVIKNMQIRGKIEQKRSVCMLAHALVVYNHSTQYPLGKQTQALP